jgi:hypothetical protein
MGNTSLYRVTCVICVTNRVCIFKLYNYFSELHIEYLSSFQCISTPVGSCICNFVFIHYVEIFSESLLSHFFNDELCQFPCFQINVLFACFLLREVCQHSQKVIIISGSTIKWLWIGLLCRTYSSKHNHLSLHFIIAFYNLQSQGNILHHCGFPGISHFMVYWIVWYVSVFPVILV